MEGWRDSFSLTVPAHHSPGDVPAASNQHCVPATTPELTQGSQGLRMGRWNPAHEMAVKGRVLPASQVELVTVVAKSWAPGQRTGGGVGVYMFSVDGGLVGSSRFPVWCFMWEAGFPGGVRLG